MRKLYIFSLLLATFATQTHTNLDSFYTIWQERSQSDSIRLDAFQNYIWDGFMFPQPDSAFVLSGELIAFAIDNNYIWGRARGMEYQDIAQDIMGNSSKSRDYWENSIALYKQIGDQKRIAIKTCPSSQISQQGHYAKC